MFYATHILTMILAACVGGAEMRQDIVDADAIVYMAWEP